MISDLESNIVAVERIKEYSETPNEVLMHALYFVHVLMSMYIMFMSVHVQTSM